jgi:hypothetical protein
MIRARPVSSGLSVVTQSFREAGRLSRRRAAIEHILLPGGRPLNNPLDKRLIEALRGNVPHAKVLQGDALEIIQNVSFDVLIGNLPNAVTESLIGFMPGLFFPDGYFGSRRIN